MYLVPYINIGFHITNSKKYTLFAFVRKVRVCAWVYIYTLTIYIHILVHIHPFGILCLLVKEASLEFHTPNLL